VLARSDPSGHDNLADREAKREETRHTAPPDLLEAFNKVLDDPLWLVLDEENQLPLSVFEPFYRKERAGGKDSFLCILFDLDDPRIMCSIRTTQSTHAKNHAKSHFDYRVYACHEW
jgi:hypothetical protein